MARNSASSHAFTLIELLIVVAIIVILAAVATPNFLEAQTRSKVSRVQSDLRTAALAVESYRLDNNVYATYSNPFDENEGTMGSPLPAVEAYLPTRLTTPIAYLSSLPVTPFPEANASSHVTYRYFNRRELFLREPNDGPAEWKEKMKLLFGSSSVAKEWEIFSYGPDRIDDDGALAYDPTNGTVSHGDTVRFGP